MKDSPRAKSLLCNMKPLPTSTEKIFVGDPNIVVLDLTVISPCVPHGWDDPNDLVALGISRNNDGTKFVVLFCISLSDRKHRRKCSAISS